MEYCTYKDTITNVSKMILFHLDIFERTWISIHCYRALGSNPYSLKQITDGTVHKYRVLFHLVTTVTLVRLYKEPREMAVVSVVNSPTSAQNV